MDYAVNRTYDSSQGRFTQVDPIGMSAANLGNPQTLNLYSYCGNDPVNHTDPNGLFWGSLFRWISRAFKWIAIAVVVASFIMLSPYAPGSTSLLGKILLGLINFGAKIGAGVNSFLGTGGVLINAAGEGSLLAQVLLAAQGAAILTAGSEIAKSLAKVADKGKRRFPCPPTASRIINRFGRTFSDLFLNQSGHRTEYPSENGGWIYQKTNGDLFFKAADQSRRSPGEIKLLQAYDSILELLQSYASKINFGGKI